MANRFIADRTTDSSASTTPTEFEFNERHNTEFRALSGVMKFVAVVTIVYGGLEVLQGVRIGINLGGLLTIGQGVALFASGAWLASASAGFKDITKTKGGDIGHLMFAIGKLKNVFTLQAVLFALAAILFVISIVIVKTA